MKKAIAALAATGRLVAGWLPDGLLVGGALSVAYGAGEIYAPASWIVLGAFALTAGVLLAKGGK